LAQERKQFADFAQFLPRAALFPVEGYAPCDPLNRAEEVAEHGHLSLAAILVNDILKKKGRTAFVQNPFVNFGHLAVGGDLFGYSHQITVFLKPVDKVTQGCVGGHGRVSVSRKHIAREGAGVTPLTRHNPTMPSARVGQDSRYVNHDRTCRRTFMKLWKRLIMVAGLSLAVAENANADAGLVHISPSLALAEPCGSGSGCAFTWTLATRFGVALDFAEKRYGRRDLNWTLLGVDFARVNAPQIFYAGHGGGRQDIVIQLTTSAAVNEKQALFQLAVRSSGIEIGPGYISAENYQDAYWTIVELERAQPDFQRRTAALRRRHKSLFLTKLEREKPGAKAGPYGDASRVSMVCGANHLLL